MRVGLVLQSPRRPRWVGDLWLVSGLVMNASVGMTSGVASYFLEGPWVSARLASMGFLLAAIGTDRIWYAEVEEICLRDVLWFCGLGLRV